jgi:integrase/recombinase XerD
MRIVKKFFEYLESRQMVLVNPAERLDLPNLGSRLPPAVLKEHEMSRLLSRPNVVTDLGLRDRAILEVLYSTAIRRSECCSLMVQDVDLEGGFLRVNLGKGRKGRVVPLGKKACDYLKQYLLKVRPKLTNNPDCQHLFIGAWQKPLEGEGLNQIVRKYAVKADIQKPVTVHTFRRSAITHMLKGNAHPMYLQRMLGHATSETVRKYVKMTAKEIKATHNRTHPLEKSRNAKLRRTAEKIH